MSTDRWASRFPALFEPAVWMFDHVPDGLDVEFSLDLPAAELVSNVHVIARVGADRSGVVVCGNDLGWRFLPGGTREPGESVEDTARRELLEEAGAVLTGPLTWIGGYRITRRPGSERHRPHLPHPVSYSLFAAADVVVDRAPLNPPDGENVTEVLVLPPTRAIDYLAGFTDITKMSLVLQLAVEMGHV